MQRGNFHLERPHTNLIDKGAEEFLLILIVIQNYFELVIIFFYIFDTPNPADKLTVTLSLDNNGI